MYRVCILLVCVHVCYAFRINRGDAGTLTSSNSSENETAALHSASEIKRLVAESYSVPAAHRSADRQSSVPKERIDKPPLKHPQRVDKRTEHVQDAHPAWSMTEEMTALAQKAFSSMRRMAKPITEHSQQPEAQEPQNHPASDFAAMSAMVLLCVIACFAALWYFSMRSDGRQHSSRHAQSPASLEAENTDPLPAARKSIANPYGGHVASEPGQRRASVPYAKAGAENASSSSQSYTGIKPPQPSPFEDLVRHESAAFAESTSSDEASDGPVPEDVSGSKARRKSTPYDRDVGAAAGKGEDHATAGSEPQRAKEKKRTVPYAMRVADGTEKTEPLKGDGDASKKTERRPSIPYATFWRGEPKGDA